MRSAISAMILGIACLWLCPSADGQLPESIPVTGDVQGVHDPSIIRAGNTWYVVATGKSAAGGQLGMRCSEDLQAWRHCGDIFEAVPAWIRRRSPGTKDLWAPDISFEHGEYRVYYAYSIFGKNTSGIALVTKQNAGPWPAPDYRWQDRGMVLESVATDNFNAIDPNYIEDREHHAWLAFGSFWGGIQLRALNAATGLPLQNQPGLYALAARGQPSPDVPQNDFSSASKAVEAPFLVWHRGYYYLFTSFDRCCSGAASTYRTMVGRSRRMTGPYVDRDGVSLERGGGTEVLKGNDHWAGPGGGSVLMRGTDGADLFVFHAYSATTGRPLPADFYDRMAGRVADSGPVSGRRPRTHL